MKKIREKFSLKGESWSSHVAVLMPGESEKVAFKLNAKDFSVWADQAHKWQIFPGIFGLEVAASSRDVALRNDTAAPVWAVASAERAASVPPPPRCPKQPRHLADGATRRAASR